MAALGVLNQPEAVQIEQGVERRFVLLHRRLGYHFKITNAIPAGHPWR
jgi:hypothetical protein